MNSDDSAVGDLSQNTHVPEKDGDTRRMWLQSASLMLRWRSLRRDGIFIQSTSIHGEKQTTSTGYCLNMSHSINDEPAASTTNWLSISLSLSSRDRHHCHRRSVFFSSAYLVVLSVTYFKHFYRHWAIYDAIRTYNSHRVVVLAFVPIQTMYGPPL